MSKCEFYFLDWDRFVIIDDRFEEGKTYGFDQFSLKLYNIDAPSMKWAPILIIPISERRTPAEAKELAKELCNMLTAQWVKGQLGG